LRQFTCRHEVILRRSPLAVSSDDWTELGVTTTKQSCSALIIMNARVGHLFFKFSVLAYEFMRGGKSVIFSHELLLSLA
jgi:hypothetical protein